MRSLLLLSLVAVSITPALGMSTKEKVRMILWVKGIKETPKTQVTHVVYPEEIERPLRKL